MTKICKLCEQQYLNTESNCPHCRTARKNFKRIIIGLEEEYWYIINETEDLKAYQKAGKIVRTIISEIEQIEK